MSSALKQHPANDLHPRASQQMSCVALPRRYWNKNRLIAASIAISIAMAGIGTVAYASRTATLSAPPVIALQTPKPAEPATVQNYDITLNTLVPDPKPQTDVPSFDEKMPNDALPQIADINVEDDALTQAAQHALPLLQSPKAEPDQAIHVLYRAAQLEPANMLFRLQLAVMYDRAGKNAGAAQLYHQVLEAYDQQQANLPPSINIDSIRHRAAYLDRDLNQ